MKVSKERRRNLVIAIILCLVTSMTFKVLAYYGTDVEKFNRVSDVYLMLTYGMLIATCILFVKGDTE